MPPRALPASRHRRLARWPAPPRADATIAADRARRSAAPRKEAAIRYPFWDVALGYGPLMAAIAIVHVFVSHFAIGGGLYLVVTETFARRSGDTARLAYLERLSRFFVLTTLVFGALTGVGIWFVIGLLNPAATELLIHHFVWGWAIEWTFFVVEILAAILYFYGWRRVPPRTHLAFGWIYFVAAWLSLVVIDGILSFMLTPGRWSVTGKFWDGFLNPGYLPSLVLRTGVCVMLAGLYALLVTSRLPADATKASLVRTNALWALAGLAIVWPSYGWFFRTLPAEVLHAARESMPAVMTWHHLTGTLALVLAAAVAVLGLGLGRRFPFVAALALMALGFAWFGSFEFLRETIRKPWIVTGAMYGNGIALAELPELQRDGILAHAAYRTGDDGRDLYLRACRSCHTLSGYRSLRHSFDGTDREFVAGSIRGVHRMRGHMPQFAGTPAEVATLASWIDARIDHRPLAEIYGVSGAALGAKVFEVRCGHCHVAGGFQDPTATLAGLSASDLSDFLDSAGDLSPEMPAYTGTGAEREALVAHLAELAARPRPAATAAPETQP